MNSTAERILYASAAELGAESGTSNASVVRTLQKLGYTGLSELKQQVAVPYNSPEAPEERLENRLRHLGESFEAINGSVWNEVDELIDLARTSITKTQFSESVTLLMQAETVFTYGLGTSGIAAEYLMMRLNRTGRRARRLEKDGFGMADELLQLSPRDAVVILSPGRVTREIRAVLTRSRAVGAPVVFITSRLEAELGEDVAVTLLAPHTPTGLTNETLTSLLVCDVLLHGVAAVDNTLALETSHQLTTLRASLGY